LVEPTIRPALASDASRIRALIRLVHINPTGLSWRRFKVAVLPDGELVACGQVKPHPGGILELASIAVHPGYRGQGLGRAIIEALLAGGDNPLYLICRDSLAPLYNKFNFHSVTGEQLPPIFKRWLDLGRRFLPVELVVMRRDTGGNER